MEIAQIIDKILHISVTIAVFFKIDYLSALTHLLVLRATSLGLLTKIKSRLANREKSKNKTYAICLERRFSDFFLKMYSIKLRLFLKVLPLAFKYKSWYLRNKELVEISELNEKNELTNACQSSWHRGTSSATV